MAVALAGTDTAIGLQGPVQSSLFAFLGRTEDWDWDWTDLNMEDWDWD